MRLPWLESGQPAFPPTEQAFAEPNGLLAAGGSLSPDWLIAAYRRGIFPWYEEGQPLLWWTPDPRMILEPGEMHVSRSLRRTLRRGEFRVSADEAFAEVIDGCAEPRGDLAGTWITPAMRRGYIELHRQGIAHSIEVWRGEELVGGVYGIALGRVFFGESMFSRAADASKVALANLSKLLRIWDFELIDCQVSSPHLVSLGAKEIPRKEFEARLQAALRRDAIPGPWSLTSC